MRARRGISKLGWVLGWMASLAAARGAVAASPGATVVPDRFLRSWDPVTLFFTEPVGPAAGGAEDRPERFARLSPVQPGAFTWLDARTLQFRPAVPWPSFSRVTIETGGKTLRLATLLAAPTTSQPAAGAEGLPPLEEIALTFAEPVAPDALAEAMRIEIRPLPGLASGDSRLLSRQDFTIKPLERAGSGEAATYVVQLRQAVPLGQRVLLGLRSSLDDPPDRVFTELAFSTAEPFRVVRIGCRRTQLPAVPEGVRYSTEQALDCEAENPAIIVEFNAEPVVPSAVEARNLVRLQPPVVGLEPRVVGRRLELAGDFDRDTAYRLTVAPAPLVDRAGRPLDLAAANQLTLSFARPNPFLRWAAASGIVERFGPQMVPLAGRGDERVDVRLARIDPLARDFWPFPEQPVDLDESARPPGPGEEPEAFAAPLADPSPREIADRIAALGAPDVSAIVDLPLRRNGASASFGLDLAPLLARAAGAATPGTYLVGLRRLDGSSTRSWMRLQVTDLALSTLEESERVVFVVTSLSSAAPVAGAAVEVEGVVTRGSEPATREVFFRGTTDASGRLTWNAPGASEARQQTPRRLIVSKGDDRLVLDCRKAPDRFADNLWSESSEIWLDWTGESLAERSASPEPLVHLFAERPVHRPEEPVHLKGYARERLRGRLTPISGPATLVVEGPGDLVWRYPLEIGGNGSFYWKFDEQELPTGSYRARLELADGTLAAGSASFRKEAYRLPRFEVRLDGPTRAPLDREFAVTLLATYYAGGRVASRPVAWRVTQFPYDWRPAARAGFLYSSDGRFSRARSFESTPALERADTTDENGGAKLVLNPALEPSAQPRTYVVEGTVVGADDQTVTATRQVVALPPFLLGLKVPRYVERAGRIAPEVLVIGPDEKPVEGQEVTLRLLHRRWHAHLRASDATDGVARYVTEVVDEPVEERRVVSSSEPLPVELALPEAGVYIVELESHDRLDRAQTIAVDLFAGGDSAVAWEKPPASVFQVTPDRARYAPGEVARLVLQSPFQNGEAIAAVEAPEGMRYQWLPVRGGQAVFELPIEGAWTPRLPVHFLLLRGRLAGSRPLPGNATDLGRPATFGATAWLEVDPTDRRLDLKLEAPSRARPGEEIEVALALRDPAGRPLAGEATLWLVDQAVLALGREARLDPLPSFLTAMRSRFAARDTRALIFGFLPFVERPGGGEGEEGQGPLDRQTVRKNFQPVPYYNPAIVVGPEGTARVRVRLSDDLTNFELRAKAVSGAERFGSATGHLEVRQPVVLQPALPRFVRPGDRFSASAVARVLEGGGGEGSAEVRLEGLELSGPSRRAMTWRTDAPTRLDFDVSVPTPAVDAEGAPARREVALRFGVERTADRVGDAFEVELPIVPDRRRVVLASSTTLAAGSRWALPEPREETRAGTLRRKLLVSSAPGVLELASGLDFLLRYPYGCTEQRLSTARAGLALRRFRGLLHLEGGEERLDRSVQETLAWLPLVRQPDGLLAYWPGSQGSVALTAWVAEFLVEAKEAGYSVDEAQLASVGQALSRALRSDFDGFVDGESWAERTWALAALARLGKLDVAYANELARRAQFLDLENVASVVLAFERGGDRGAPALADLESTLWHGFEVRLREGREVFGGLRAGDRTPNGLLLPSEARTMAEILRALAPRAQGDDQKKKLGLLRDALVARGRGDGWGTTNANAAAILALTDALGSENGGAAARLELASASGAKTLTLSSGEPTASWSAGEAGPVALTLESAEGEVQARAELSYLPDAPGSRAVARRDGFVVTREQLLYRAGSPSGSPPERSPLEEPGHRVELAVGDVVEEHVVVVNPDDRNFVAVVVPLAAGLEPLNPELETAPPEARPAGRDTLEPTYRAALDDAVAYYFNTLAKGTYHFYFRSRAQVPGEFVQPPASAELMYDGSVVGSGCGAVVAIAGAPVSRE